MIKKQLPILLLSLCLCGILLAGCKTAVPSPTPSRVPFTTTPPATSTPLLFFPRTSTPGQENSQVTSRVTLEPGVPSVVLPESVEVLLLVGQDLPDPYVGRTDALMLLFFDTVQSSGGVLSLPPDLMVSIPGYGTGRLNSAYALGDVQTLLNTISFNMGITPDHYAILNTDTFEYFIDDIGGLQLRVDDPMMKKCNEVNMGSQTIDGAQALCIFRLRSGPDEVSRNERQGTILKAIFKALVTNGNLARVPQLLDDFGTYVKSDLSPQNVIDLIPMTLRMGDGRRFAVYTLPASSLTTRVVGSGTTSTTYLVADIEVVRQKILEIASVVSLQKDFSELLPTLEYALTVSPTPTPTRKPTTTPVLSPTTTLTATPTITITPTPTQTLPVWNPRTAK